MSTFDFRFVKIQTKVAEWELYGEDEPKGFVPTTALTTLDYWPDRDEGFGDELLRRTFPLEDYRKYFPSNDEVRINYEIHRRQSGTKSWAFYCHAMTYLREDEN